MIIDIIICSSVDKNSIISNEGLIIRNEKDFETNYDVKMFCNVETFTIFGKMNDLSFILLYIQSNKKSGI